MKITVVGTGYVGLPTGLILAELSHDVICVDRDPAKVEAIASGRSPIHEPGTEELLALQLASGKFRVTTDLAQSVKQSDIVMLAVGTPPGDDGYPNMTELEAAAREVARAVEGPLLLVTKSTVPVGTGDRLEEIFCEEGVAPGHVQVLSNPEFLQEGSAIKNSRHPDRILVGAKDKATGDRLAAVYQGLNAPVLVTDRRSAEMIKYANNCFLATKISFANALSQLCEASGADIGEVVRGLGMDSRIGAQFLSAGLGWGGSCLPKDVSGLLAYGNRVGYDFGLLREAQRVNTRQVGAFLARLEQALGGYAGKKVALWGLAFKPNTDDVRESKAIEAIQTLRDGGATVIAYDPVASHNMKQLLPDLNLAGTAAAAAEGADAILLVTEWPEFAHQDFDAIRTTMRTPILFDGRRMLISKQLGQQGWDYQTIGKKPDFVA